MPATKASASPVRNLAKMFDLTVAEWNVIVATILKYRKVSLAKVEKALQTIVDAKGTSATALLDAGDAERVVGAPLAEHLKTVLAVLAILDGKVPNPAGQDSDFYDLLEANHGLKSAVMAFLGYADFDAAIAGGLEPTADGDEISSGSLAKALRARKLAAPAAPAPANGNGKELLAEIVRILGLAPDTDRQHALKYLGEMMAKVEAIKAITGGDVLEALQLARESVEAD